MESFIDYLAKQIEAGQDDIARLENAGCMDDADFAKVKTNIYDVCRTVTIALINCPGKGAEAVKEQFARFRTTWNEALDKAREHGENKKIVVEETKLEALEDVIAHFPEVEK